ncbi:MAG: hypothetical protein KBT03_12815 [Bacteroidales bacterium]|nr:hypothetical protein [Candidatus Scybalousia scybalohippi]
MAYIHKHTWVNDSEPDIDADNLNEIEEGIENAADKADEAYSIATTNADDIRTLKQALGDIGTVLDAINGTSV